MPNGEDPFGANPEVQRDNVLVNPPSDSLIPADRCSLPRNPLDAKPRKHATSEAPHVKLGHSSILQPSCQQEKPAVCTDGIGSSTLNHQAAQDSRRTRTARAKALYLIRVGALKDHAECLPL